MCNWRLFSCFFGCLVVSSAAARSGPQATSSPPTTVTSPAAQPVARILLLALDDSGKPVEGLAKDELNVWLDGKSVEVEEIRAVKDEPLVFSMIVDESASTLLSARQQTTAAIHLFRALATGENHGFLVLFNDDARASDHPIDAETAEQTLTKAVPRGSTALFDAILVACTQQLHSATLSHPTRRAIFVFSDGADNTSRHSLIKTVETVQKEGVPIFSIKIRVDDERTKDSKSEFLVLKTLSEQTGGIVIAPGHGEDLFRQLPSILMGQYLLTVKTGDLKRKKAYSLKIVAGTKDVHVLAQTEYFAP